MAKIYWDEDERNRIIQLVFSMRQNDPESSLVAIVNRAMSQLPKDRQRTIPSIKSIPWLAEAIKSRFAEQRQQLSTAESTTQSAEQVKEQHASLRDKLKTMVEQARARALDEASLDDLVLALAARIGARLDGLEQRVHSLESRPRTQAPPPVAQPAKKTVLVVGLLPDQMNHVRAHFRTAPLDLRRLSTDDLSKGVPQADYAVLNTKFLSHKMQSLVQSRVGKTYLVHGGLSTVIERIEQLLCGGGEE